MAAASGFHVRPAPPGAAVALGGGSGRAPEFSSSSLPAHGPSSDGVSPASYAVVKYDPAGSSLARLHDVYEQLDERAAGFMLQNPLLYGLFFAGLAALTWWQMKKLWQTRLV